MSDAEDRLRQDVRDAMAAYGPDEGDEVTWRIVRKVIVVVFFSFAAVVLFMEFGGDKGPGPTAASRPATPDSATVQTASRAQTGNRAQTANQNDGASPGESAEEPVEEWDVSDAIRELVIEAGRGGHFTVDAAVNGTELPFLVDTGATSVFLSAEAAREVGIDPDTLTYSKRYRTANGIVAAAPVTLREVRIGQLSIRDVEATVSRQPLPVSLLGMSFLDRLESYEVRSGKLIMRW